MLNNKWIFSGIISGLLLYGGLTGTAVFAQSITVPTSRISGMDRYETSVAISKAGWLQATTIIIASGLDYPDALAASALSKSKDAPILLTEKDTLAPITLAEIKRLKATQVFLIGGTGVIGDSIENQLKGLGIGITRIGGTDRYDTSKKVAEIIGVSNGVIVSSGLNFPDALSIAPIAGMKSIPILLSPKDALNPNIAAFLKGKTIPISYIVGGTGVLDTSIESSLLNIKRLSGIDRYATNLSINNEFAGAFNFDTVYLASGNDFPDALGGSALAAKNNAPIFLTDKDSISDATIKIIKSKNVKHVIILGGIGVVSTNVETIVDNAVSSLKILATSLTLNKTTDNLTVGDSDTLIATVAPIDATNKDITWTSLANSIATVDKTGKVTAIKEGTTITGTTIDGNFNATCNVTVIASAIGFGGGGGIMPQIVGNVPTPIGSVPTPIVNVPSSVVNVTAISLDKATANITVGDTDILIATLSPSNATNQSVSWTSSNNAIATVDNTGKVTGVSTGTVTMTGTTVDGSKLASCFYTITNNASIIFKDASLQAVVRALITKPTGEIYLNDVINIHTLNTSLYTLCSKIKDLTGIEYLTGLQALDLSNNLISDISALKGLTNLTSLDLSGNKVTGISSLQGLTSLTELRLYNNQISAITALQGLSRLTYLDLSSNQITSISDLKELYNLGTLDLSSNLISDITDLQALFKITNLYLSGNSISDIFALKNKLNLQVVDLSSTKISAADRASLSSTLSPNCTITYP